MLLAINVGNTNIRFGVYEGKKMTAHWKLATNRSWTADEFGMHFVNFFNYEKLSISDIEAVIIASVVPPIMFSFEHAIEKYLKKKPIIIGPGVKTGINIKYENPRELGADRDRQRCGSLRTLWRSCHSSGFRYGHHIQCHIVERRVPGGSHLSRHPDICGSILYQRTAKLPKIDLAKHDSAIGRNTAVSMQLGVFHGYVGQVNHLVSKIKQEMKEENIKVIATGGLAKFIAL